MSSTAPTGKLISAEKLGKVTWAKGIDMATRASRSRSPGVRYEDGEALMWPGSGGVHNWQPMSFSPDTGLTYIPAHEMPGYYNDKGFDPKTYDMERDGPMGLNGFHDDIPKSAGSSSLIAWDPVTQKKAWEVALPGATNGGVMSTHGGLVFQGQSDGGSWPAMTAPARVLWSADMGVGTQAPPITYSVGGRQYVSILAGWAGGQMLLGSLSAQHGWVGRDHPRRLLTYVLDGNAALPPSPPPSQPVPVDDPAFKVDPALALKGRALYDKCLICHGAGAVAGGFAPDLRASAYRSSADAFAAGVPGGLASRGMPPFPELTPQDQSCAAPLHPRARALQAEHRRADRRRVALPGADDQDEAQGLGLDLAAVGPARSGVARRADGGDDAMKLAAGRRGVLNSAEAARLPDCALHRRPVPHWRARLLP